jgi:hypothetical protein
LNQYTVQDGKFTADAPADHVLEVQVIAYNLAGNQAKQAA